MTESGFSVCVVVDPEMSEGFLASNEDSDFTL